ncbi:MAG TPA: hypothetical protein VG734_07785 [Lacunisphaera sp.]|nr:hypothetical protein [Lacunisphaera sp.]
MNSALGRTLVDHFAPIKLEWVRRLADEPPLSALGRQDTVGFLVEGTLMQLLRGLSGHATADWPEGCRPLVGPVHSHCACGLDPMQRYFAAGEQALRHALGEKPEVDHEEMLRRFHALARHECEMFCSTCVYRGTSDRCPPPSGPSSPAVDSPAGA